MFRYTTCTICILYIYIYILYNVAVYVHIYILTHNHESLVIAQSLSEVSTNNRLWAPPRLRSCHFQRPYDELYLSLKKEGDGLVNRMMTWMTWIVDLKHSVNYHGICAGKSSCL